MARYLNPPKICLLALLELYVEEQVPSDAILPVLSFIASHVMDHTPKRPAASHWAKAERVVSMVISIKDFEKLLGSYPFLMQMPGRKLWDLFLTKIWGINSLYALNSFFENLGDMVAKTKDEKRRLEALGEPVDDDDDDENNANRVRLSPSSPLATFIRRASLEYQRLQFHDCTELWKNFVRYRQPTAHYLKRKIPGFNRLSFDAVLHEGEKEEWDHEGAMGLASVAYGDMLTGDETSSLPVSTNDIEALLEFQITQMQKYGNRIPLEVRHQFHDLLNDSYVLPSLTHYLTFLDAWRGGDYPTAFDYLHRYFDYTMQNRDRLFYQYALMNLAVLQADFGCHQEAVAAMLEAVTTARENRDMTCLNFSLNWLFHFGRAHPELVQDLESSSMLGTGKESLAFLRVKAKETGMWTLWSSVLLSEAKLCLANGESIAMALESMIRSSQVIVEKNMQNMFGSKLSLEAALWDRLGVSQLASMTCDIFLRCHRDDSIFDDELKVTCRLSMLLADRGKYDEALDKFGSLDENALRSWKPSQYWHKYRAIIRLQRDLRHNNLDGADQLLFQLMQSKMDDLEPEMTFLVDTLQIEYLTRRQNLQAAFAKVNEMLVSLRDEKRDVALRVRLLLLKVSLLDKCGRPQRGFTIAMRAASICWRSRLVSLLWQSIGAVANILVSLGEFSAACQLLTSVIPRSLECDAVIITAQLYSVFADANMGLAGQHPDKSAKRTEYLTAAAAAVQKSSDNYASIEDIGQQCQLMAKKAMIMKLLGDKVLAADYAASYVLLKKTAESLSA